MGINKISKYYEGHDGTKLATDIYLPDMLLSDEKMSVLLVAFMESREVMKELFGSCVERMVEQGYAVAMMETRGMGTSYGFYQGFYNQNDGKDIATVIDKLAKEEFCNGKVGLFGGLNPCNCNLLIGPWRHSQMYVKKIIESYENLSLKECELDWIEEHIRFFDWALKNVENGMDNIPRIKYYTRNAKRAWNYAIEFPLDNQRMKKMYFTTEKSETIKSKYDGTINEKKSQTIEEIKYHVDTTIQNMDYGKLNRILEGKFKYDAKKFMTFTSDVFYEDVEVTGIPFVELYVKSTYENENFITILEEVTQDGENVFLTDGAMKASHAKLTENEILKSMGLPYHGSMENDAVYLDSYKPLKLEFNMEALSYILRRGSRLRLNVFCGVSNNDYDQLEGLPVEETIVTLLTGGEYASGIHIPFVKRDVNYFKTILSIRENGSDFEKQAEIYTFKKAIYIKIDGKWTCYPCKNYYEDKDGSYIYKTEEFIVVKTRDNQNITMTLAGKKINAGEKCSII